MPLHQCQSPCSRQIAVFGLETMGALIKLKVLIVGVKGVGVEIAKNLILAGPRAVTLVDGARLLSAFCRKRACVCSAGVSARVPPSALLHRRRH